MILTLPGHGDVRPHNLKYQHAQGVSVDVCHP